MFKINFKKSMQQSVASNERAGADQAPDNELEDITQSISLSPGTSSTRRHGSRRRHDTSHRSPFGSSSNTTNHIPPASKAAIQGLVYLRLRAKVPESLREACLNEECVICAEAFSDKDVVTTLPCGHMHHYDCIVDWLSCKCTCPTCRHEMPTDDKNFEDFRAHRHAQAATADQTATDAAANIAAIFNSEKDDKMGEDSPLVLHDLADMVSMKRSAYVACQDHTNLNLIVRRTLRIKQEIENQRAVVEANHESDDAKSENACPSTLDECVNPTNTPVDPAYYRELHAGY
jgi:hypothetical protein